VTGYGLHLITLDNLWMNLTIQIAQERDAQRAARPLAQPLCTKMINVYKKRLIIIHSIGVVLCFPFAWIALKFGGCAEYGLPNCTRVYFVFPLIAAIPIPLVIFLNKVTYKLLYGYNVVLIILLFPLGTAIGALSIKELKRYKNSA